MATKLLFYPATKSRWKNVETLFGERGACGGCWCMSWRLKRADYERGKGSKNKTALKNLVTEGESPGIIAYEKGKPIGWCSVAPREDFIFLGNSRVLAPIDDAPVWSISCLFVEKQRRSKGVSVALLKAAADYVKKRRGKIIEGYPVVPYTDKMPDAFAWTGTVAAFEKAGFEEAARRSKSRPIMRYYI